MVLSFHLPDLPIEFGSSNLSQLSLSNLKLLSWMKFNAIYPYEQYYLYAEFSAGFVWDTKKQDWRPRRKI